MGFIAEAEPPGAPALPWATPPSDMGLQRCDWCGRDIYRPALPCAVQTVPNLLSMETRPGFGDRCKWEVQTRVRLEPALE